MSQNHHFHLVNYSPWPLTSAIGLMIMLTGSVNLFHNHLLNLFILGLTITLFSSYQWWRDISRESTFQGLHTIQILKGLKWGMMLFIISEILFFFSFFWTFFNSSLNQMIELGLMWPPKGINPFNAFKVPLLNTIILLSSGLTVTWCHHSILNKNYSQTLNSLLLTILLGIYFTFIQSIEYLEASFSISESSYGSIFFIITGFHGIHVMMGTLFLIVCLMRHNFNHFSKNHHFGFEAAAWYWHFVDIIWLFVYIFIYWWGGN